MSKLITLCSVLLLAVLLVPAAVADEAAPVTLEVSTTACAAELPNLTPAEGEVVHAPDDALTFLSTPGCDPCRDLCAITQASCKAACGFDWQCIQQCNCDFYWCVDGCGCEQDPPPAGC
jgi:hypothetical protein